MQNAFGNSSLRRALAVVGIWLVPGLLQCVQEATYAKSNGAADVSLPHILLHFLPSWLPWAAFTPAVLWIARRFPFQRGTLARALPVHMAACVAFGGLHLIILGLFRTNFPPAPWAEPDLGAWLTRTLWSLHSQAEVLAYAGVVMAGHAFAALRSARERELRAARLEGQLTEARLAALREQLHPHFLFNTLNAIDVLMVDDPQRAGEMLRRLSDLLRLTLEDIGPLHSLAREFEHLRCYLGIESVRFSDRLKTKLEAQEDTLDLAVPSLLLQTLVENALRHGIAPRAAGGCVSVRARRDGGWLELVVEDDGEGFQGELCEGIGLSNSRARLAGLFGAEHSFEIEAGAAGGTRVLVRIPARTEWQVSRG